MLKTVLRFPSSSYFLGLERSKDEIKANQILLLFSVLTLMCCRMPGPGYPMMVGYPMMPQMPQLAHVAPLLMPGTGSIRSVQSVPMLSAAGHVPGHHTWDGEPCPVHHHHQHPMVPLAALYGE